MRNVLIAVALLIGLANVAVANVPYSYDIERHTVVVVPQHQVQTYRVYPHTEIRQSWLFPNLYWHHDVKIVVPVVPERIQTPSSIPALPAK